MSTKPDTTQPDSESQLTSPVSEGDSDVTQNVSEHGDEPYENPSVTKIVTNLFDPETAAPAPVMPEVQQHAVVAARERISAENGEGEDSTPTPSNPVSKEIPQGAPIKGETDVDGNPFSPSLHESPMRLNKAGYIAKRRGTVNGKSAPAPTESLAVDPNEGKVDKPSLAIPTTVDPKVIAANAELCSGLFISAAKMVGGAEFEPEKGEQEGMTKAFNVYFTANGIIDIPPCIALTLTLGMYVGSRWNKPVFAEKRTRWWDKAKDWLSVKFT